MNHLKTSIYQNNRARNPAHDLSEKRLLNGFAFLICNRAGGLASGLAGACALAAAALLGGSLQVSLIDSYYVLQWEHLFQYVLR